MGNFTGPEINNTTIYGDLRWINNINSVHVTASITSNALTIKYNTPLTI